jgi:hypothetical protein
MKPLQLWGRLSSINVRKVVWTLQELDLPFERTDAGMQFGVVQTPAYLAMNLAAFGAGHGSFPCEYYKNLFNFGVSGGANRVLPDSDFHVTFVRHGSNRRGDVVRLALRPI